MHRKFEPQLVTVLREGYSRKLFAGDLTAGVITGIVALPLAVAFAIASGVAPAQGFYTAIIAGLIISILSGSRFQIGGPTGAFVVMVYSIIHQFGMSGLALATIMAGIILVLMGVMRLGSLIKYIPYPVTQGFTSGIAVVIASTQLKPLLGLDIESLPIEFAPKIITCFGNISSCNLWTVIISTFTILILIFWSKVTDKIPGSIIAIIVCTLLVKLFSIPVTTIGSEFGQVSVGLPDFTTPEISFKLISQLFPVAVSIAMLGAIESLLSAVVADGMTGTRHRSDMELVAQGAANIICPFLGGIPATGAIARTATNIKNGGKTPFAGIIHALVLLLILICLGSLASMIPMCVLAGILLGVALKMSEYKLFIKMFRAPKSDIYVMIITFSLTVLLDLTIAIPVGMILASLLFMRRMEQVCGAKIICSDDDDTDMDDERHDPFALSKFQVPDEVVVFEINGPFFFGAASKFQDDLISPDVAILILRMRNVPAIDATGLFALEKIIKLAHHNGRKIIISGINTQPLAAINKSGLIEKIGSQAIHRNISTALQYATELLNDKHNNQ
ncbi:MAG: sulfate permease [Phycisphaerae bacterium]|nr:sulfate permease [Phycisphaerae bacterium]